MPRAFQLGCRCRSWEYPETVRLLRTLWESRSQSQGPFSDAPGGSFWHEIAKGTDDFAGPKQVRLVAFRALSESSLPVSRVAMPPLHFLTPNSGVDMSASYYLTGWSARSVSARVQILLVGVLGNCQTVEDALRVQIPVAELVFRGSQRILLA